MRVFVLLLCSLLPPSLPPTLPPFHPPFSSPPPPPPLTLSHPRLFLPAANPHRSCPCPQTIPSLSQRAASSSSSCHLREPQPKHAPLSQSTPTSRSSIASSPLTLFSLSFRHLYPRLSPAMRLSTATSTSMPNTHSTRSSSRSSILSLVLLASTVLLSTLVEALPYDETLKAWNLNVNKDASSDVLNYKSERGEGRNTTYTPSPDNWRALPVSLLL